MLWVKGNSILGWRYLYFGYHTCKNLIPMVVTRAMANSRKNHALLFLTEQAWSHGGLRTRELGQVMHSWCVESEKWVEICFHHWTSEKIPFLYFFLHKSWIWQTLGHVTKEISYRHFHNASKECFWPKHFLISCTGSKVPFWQKWKIAGKSIKRGFSLMSNDEKKSTHFSDSTHQECMIFARIGHGSCYYHWNEIFAGVSLFVWIFSNGQQ